MWSMFVEEHAAYEFDRSSLRDKGSCYIAVCKGYMAVGYMCLVSPRIDIACVS